MSATEIRVGNTAADSGPASAYGITAKTEAALALALKEWGAEVLITAATPKFGANDCRVAELPWKPLHFMTNVPISVGSVITPAALGNAVGIISAAYLKDRPI